MRQVSIGIRHNDDGGLEFFGTDEINKVLEQGGRVVHIEPSHALLQAPCQNHSHESGDIGGALSEAADEDYALAGCEICVTLSEPLGTS